MELTGQSAISSVVEDRDICFEADALESAKKAAILQCTHIYGKDFKWKQSIILFNILAQLRQNKLDFGSIFEVTGADDIKKVQ